MMSLRPSRVERVLLVMAGLLVFGIIYESYARPPSFDVAPVRVGSKQADTKHQVNPSQYNAPLIADFEEMGKRPLFSPLRLPPRKTETSGGAAPLPPLNASLVGVIMAPDQRIAVLKLSGSPNALNVRVGQKIGGWELVEIDSDYVVLKAGTTKREIKLPH